MVHIFFRSKNIKFILFLGKRGFGQNKPTGKKEEKIGDAINPEGFHYKVV